MVRAALRKVGPRKETRTRLPSGCTPALLLLLLLSSLWQSKMNFAVFSRYHRQISEKEVSSLGHPNWSRDVRAPVVSEKRTEQDPLKLLGRAMEPFCQRWSSSDANNRTLQPFDEWFTHHPTWIVTNETEDMFCVEQGTIETMPHIRNIASFYANQFYSSCDRVHVRSMWSSGWGADFKNMQSGMVQALDDHAPLILERELPWHYAANKDDGSNLTCPAGDTTCYFLPYQGCSGSVPELRKKSNIDFVESEELPLEAFIGRELGTAAYIFLTRKQLWLRRAVFDYKEAFKRANKLTPDADCTVMHVRRADVVLHGEGATRKYFPVSDYVKLIPEDKIENPNHYILLLTDDSNAIEEAKEFFPKLNWKHLDRPRHKGSSGGWENQTPSRNPALEVIILLATFELAQECSAIVSGHSNFADYIYEQMLLSDTHNDVKSYSVEDGARVYNDAYSTSEAELEKHLNELRKRKSGENPAISNDEKVMALERSKQGSGLRFNGTDKEDCLEEKRGIIVVNFVGLLANDLFEAAFARRMAAQLGCGWHVVYRSWWNTAFLTTRTDQCFPNALALNSNRLKPSAWTKNAILHVETTKENGDKFDPSLLYNALTYNELEPNILSDMDNHEANKMVSSWIASLGENAVEIEHMQFPLQENNVDKLVSKLLEPSSTVQVISLGAFFIHFDWMSGWMNKIGHWLHIDPSCCTTAPQSGNAIVIHIRDFEPEDNGVDLHLQVGVYRDIIERYYNGSNDREVVVVCQPKSVESDVVQDLVKEFGARVLTGSDNIDAFCILRNSQVLIASTSSTFSQMAALLAEQSNGNIQVHYPTHTLDYPPVTIKVPSWRYHLVNAEGSGIAKFDVKHKKLRVRQA